MKTYIALFRGINVGGKNSLPMKDLVSLLEALGSRNVQTCLQSGNALFQHGETDASRLKMSIGTEIKKLCGFEPCVLLVVPRRSCAGANVGVIKSC